MLSPKVVFVPCALTLALAGAAIIAYACVPADTRPVPAEVNITVSPSPAVLGGVVTADGWSVKFNRVLLDIGGTSLADSCTSYSDANYDRVLDVTYDAGQKLSQLHGIGQCDFRYRVTSPSSDSITGIGVSDDDKTNMRTPGIDPYSADAGRTPAPTGISIDVSLTATRADMTKTFHLIFRSPIRYQRCALDDDSGLPAMDLASGVSQILDIRIEAESIFRDDNEVDASLRFNPFAEADTNNDGIITLDELRSVPLDKVRDGGAFEAGTYDVDDAGVFIQGQPIAIETLGDFVYLVLVPLMPRFRDVGFCASRRDRRGGGG